MTTLQSLYQLEGSIGSGGGSIELSDGTNTYTGVELLIFNGATLSQSGVEVTVTVTGGGGGVTSYNDLTDRPTLGTASSKDSGTGAGEVLLLTETNKLPALDGSLLTNISGSNEFDRALVQAMITAGVTI